MVSLNYIIVLVLISAICMLIAGKTGKYLVLIIPAIAWATLLFK